MRIPGLLREEIFYLRILTICTVLSTALLIQQRVESTLVENTSGPLENHRVKREE